MKGKSFSKHTLINVGALSDGDLDEVTKCRGNHNKLGFSYQLIFVKLLNYFPKIKPLEIIDEILSYAATQLSVDEKLVAAYMKNSTKISMHRSNIIAYLQLRAFDEQALEKTKQFIFNESLRLEAHSILKTQTIDFLRTNKILSPTAETLKRLISAQRHEARKQIFEIINLKLSGSIKEKLNDLLQMDEHCSLLEFLKKPPQKASSEGINNLTDKLSMIRGTGVIDIDVSEISNNYQKIFAKEIRIYSIARIRALEPSHKYSALICFLNQAYQDITDFLVDSYTKVLNRAYNTCTTKVDKEIISEEKKEQKSLKNYAKMKGFIKDEAIPDIQLRSFLLKKFKEEFNEDNKSSYVSRKKSIRVFQLLTAKYNYFRKFSSVVFDNLQLKEQDHASDIISGINLLKKLDKNNKRKLSQNNIPINFIPKDIRKYIIKNKKINRSAWEVSLLIAVRDAIKNSNINVGKSKRFCKFADFFMSEDKWNLIQDTFFSKTKLPRKASDAISYLAIRLNKKFDSYLENHKNNKYAKVVKGKLKLSTDPAIKLTKTQEKELKRLKAWLKSHMTKIKLPDLLIEVDNALRFTKIFMPKGKKNTFTSDDICDVIVTIMAHGCNIGTDTMSQLAEQVSYETIKRITDWQLNDDAIRGALAEVVNAISRLGVTKNWGEGKTSSSDAHIVSYNQKVLQQDFCHRFGDFALAFYTFIADNYAPYHSIPIECNEGEAPYALDGSLYNESDLSLEEHYTDSRAAATILFAAFEFLGKKYNPRIKGIQKHRLFKIDTDKDYGVLSPLLKGKQNIIKTEYIEKQWTKMAQFYASVSSGHITASVAIKRLLSLNTKNEFYKANLELGKILKTENTLQGLVDVDMRRRRHAGLLKGEAMHALAREVNYGNGGIIRARDLIGQRNTCNCLTLIMACIVYWQAQEITRILKEYQKEAAQFNLLLLAHISPVGWDNVILYGEYIINKQKIKI